MAYRFLLRSLIPESCVQPTARLVAASSTRTSLDNNCSLVVLVVRSSRGFVTVAHHHMRPAAHPIAPKTIFVDLDRWRYHWKSGWQSYKMLENASSICKHKTRHCSRDCSVSQLQCLLLPVKTPVPPGVHFKSYTMHRQCRNQLAPHLRAPNS